jgi:YHS domain-containing protein
MIDPISMKLVVDIDRAPFIVEGEGAAALKIYFETEANKRTYLKLPVQQLTMAGYEVVTKLAVNE